MISRFCYNVSVIVTVYRLNETCWKHWLTRDWALSGGSYGLYFDKSHGVAYCENPKVKQNRADSNIFFANMIIWHKLYNRRAAALGNRS